MRISKFHYIKKSLVALIMKHISKSEKMDEK